MSQGEWRVLGRRFTPAKSPQSAGDKGSTLILLATVEAVEEAVLNGLWCASPVTGYDGTQLPTLREVMRDA